MTLFRRLHDTGDFMTLAGNNGRLMSDIVHTPLAVCAERRHVVPGWNRGVAHSHRCLARDVVRSLVLRPADVIFFSVRGTPHHCHAGLTPGSRRCVEQPVL